MLKYLKSLHQVKNSSALPDCLIVTGNQAADMDSCFSALLTAYFESISGTKTLPLIDIPRQDMRLRKDVEYVFKNLGIDPSWLIFSDDITTTSSTPLFLVDHNSPSIPGAVKSVIDHHAIEDVNFDLSRVDPLVLVKSGSCMSAVVNYFSANASLVEKFKNDDILAPLAIAPILQDTSNFSKKVEDEDRVALKFLSQFSYHLFSPAQNFATMSSEKGNLEGLSTEDLLRKDYKQWGAIGISSLPKLFHKIEKNAGGENASDIAAALVSYLSKSNLEIMVALAGGTRKKEYIRQLAYYGPSTFDMAKECPELQLEFINEVQGVKFYNQLNVAASRKQVAPALKQAFAKFTAN